MTQDEAKLAVAKRAVEFVSDGMRVGLGTGTTATLFVRELGRAVSEGLRVEAVATSEETAQLARELGITMSDFETSPVLDVTIDGADELGPDLALIKGGHGALLREKIVASAARQFIIIVDESKVVPVLGKFPLPVEVIRMALPLVRARLGKLGLDPVLRMRQGGSEPWITDEGNFLLDCYCGAIHNPADLAAQIRQIIGVVEHGLFVAMATRALIAGAGGLRELRR